MSKYEIMLILDPTSDEKVISEIVKSTFKSKEAQIEKMERTDLAYEINKSKTANYFVINVSATGDEINEFTRKSNITKSIWRIMSVNLDTEKGLQRKPKKFRKHNPNFRKPNSEKMNQENNSNPENKVSKRKNFNSEQAKTEKVKKDKE